MTYNKYLFNSIEKMKILQLITLSELGGAQSVVVNLANSLSKEHKVIVAAGEGDGKMWKGLNENIQKVHIKHLKRTLSPISDFLTLLSFVRLYYKYTKETPYEKNMKNVLVLNIFVKPLRKFWFFIKKQLIKILIKIGLR